MKPKRWSVDYKAGDESGRTYDRIVVPPRPRTETELRRIYVAAATREFPGVRFFIRNVGSFSVGESRVRAGIKGQADVYFYMRGGRGGEIELKNIRTPQTKEQKAWQAFCEEWEIPFLLLRAQSDDPIDDWLVRTYEFLKKVQR